MYLLGKTPVGPLIQHMWDQEKGHRAEFEDLIRKHRVRPTVMTPLWNVAGFMLGAGEHNKNILIPINNKNIVSILISIYILKAQRCWARKQQWPAQSL